MARRSRKKSRGIGGVLLDENMPAGASDRLTKRKYKSEYPPKGMPDYQVYQLARRQNMVLITQDRGMRRHVSSSRHPGVIIIHNGGRWGPDVVLDQLDSVLDLYNPLEDIRGQVVEISPRRISITLPGVTEDIEVPLD